MEASLKTIIDLPYIPVLIVQIPFFLFEAKGVMKRRSHNNKSFSRKGKEHHNNPFSEHSRKS